MNSSGIKRGLAGSAVAALAVTGLPFLATSASAESLAQQSGGNPVLLTPATDNSQDVSIKNDGQNTTVSLVANAPANATRVEFMYNATVIGSATRDANGTFAYEWTPPASIYNTDVTITATAYDQDGLAVGAADTATGVQVSTTLDSIELNGPSGAVGYYVPNDGSTDGSAIVSGTTSALTGTPSVETVLGGSGAGTVSIGAAGTGDTSRAFTAVVPVDGTLLDSTGTGALNQFAVQAGVGAGPETGDAQGYNAYKQTITGFTAVAKQTSVTPGGTTDVTVTVTDQNGKPVAGVTVENASNTPPTSAPGTPSNGGVTDSKGQVVFTGAEAGSHRYYADDNVDGTYNSGTEYAADVAVAEYTATPSDIAFNSKDGSAFDIDEFVSGDLTVTVKDQNGNPYDATVNYSWDYVPFKPTTTDKAQNYPMAPVTTGPDGVAELSLPSGINGNPGGTYTLKAYVNRDTTPGQQEGDLGLTPVSVKTGESDVMWDDADPAQRPAGTTQTFTGKLALADGTGLAGRDLNVVYGHGGVGTHDAVLSPQASQPAGTTRTGNTSATVKTQTNGAFGVAITDPSVVAPATPTDELDDTLTATGTAGGVGTDATEPLEVDFLVNAAPASLAVTTSAYELIDSEATPGRPVTFEVQVTNKADGTGTPLANQTVTLTTDHGFFTTAAETEADLVADPAAAEGAEYGEWKDLGDSIEVTTDENGYALVTVAIEDDEGFKTDDTVVASIDAVVGAVTKDNLVQVAFESTDPLNGGEVTVEQADDQTVEVLPKAPTNEEVYYNVFVTDQFGNLVEDELVEVTDDLAGAWLYSDWSGSDEDTVMVQSQLEDEGPALELFSNVAGDQTPTAVWDAPTTTYTDADLVTAGFQEDADGNPANGAQRSLKTPDVELEDEGETVNWYQIDFATSTYTLEHDTASSVPVGTTVIMTYTAIDQNGEPIEGAPVGVFRTGPDDYSDGEFKSLGSTDENGQVSYVFGGAKAGTATVQMAIMNGPSSIIPQTRATDQVTFESDAVPPKGINLSASGKNNGPKKDVLKVKANNNAVGLVAKVFVKGQKVASHKLNSSGDWTFKIADKNGKKVTKYTVKVAATATTKAGQDSAKIK